MGGNFSFAYSSEAAITVIPDIRYNFFMDNVKI